MQLYGDAACEAAVPAKVARDAVCPLQASFVFEDLRSRRVPCARRAARDLDALRGSPLGRCVPSDEKGVLAYARGAAIARTDFTPAFTTDAGTGRVRLRGYTDGRTPVMWTDLFDSVTGELCTPDTAKDGQIRCLPSMSVSVACSPTRVRRSRSRSCSGCHVRHAAGAEVGPLRRPRVPGDRDGEPGLRARP